MARQNASVDNLREDQIGFRNIKNKPVLQTGNLLNQPPNLNQVQFPQESFQQPDRESMTANFISNLLPKAGEVVGDVVSRGQEIAGTGLEKLTELAKDPRTYEVLSNVLAVGSAPYSPQLSQTYGNIASGIRESRIAKQEAAQEAEKDIKLKELELKKIEDERKFEEEQNVADRLNQLEIAKLKLQETPLDIEKRKKIEAETNLLELELVNKQNPISEEELLKKQANQEAYKTYLKTINDPKEAMFRTRMKDADRQLKKFETIKGNNYTKIYSPLFEKGRLLRQAKRNFATAVLRKLSGATINQSEFEIVDKIYFPQYGDSKEVLRAKQLARQRQYEIQPLKKIDDISTQENQTEQTDLDASTMSTEDLREIANG
jgi:hypothetical protein